MAPDQLPLAVQVDGLLVAVQVIVELLPTYIVDGLTVNDTAGGLGIICKEAVENDEPVALLQVKVKA